MSAFWWIVIRPEPHQLPKLRNSHRRRHAVELLDRCRGSMLAFEKTCAAMAKLHAKPHPIADEAIARGKLQGLIIRAAKAERKRWIDLQYRTTQAAQQEATRDLPGGP